MGSMTADKLAHRKLKIFLVEDHHIMRRGLASLLRTEIGAEVVGEAKDGIAALEQVGDSHPDAILMDISMPRMNGIEATRRIRQKFPWLKILILSMYDNPALVSQALQAGASGYLLKESMVEELSQALETIMQGRVFISPLVENISPDPFFPFLPGAEPPPTEELTKREYEVIQCLADGKSVAQIATELCVSIYTVYTHITNLKRKLNLHTQTEIIRYAVEHAISRNKPDSFPLEPKH
jgi:DNA-binding NarL/FixJ family response regulator